MFLFCDASFDKNSHHGVSAILVLTDNGLTDETTHAALVQTRVAQSKSIAELELATVLWGFEELAKATVVGAAVTLFTDHQTISELAERRPRLEAAQFKSGRTGKLLSNAELYRAFFKVCDRWKPEIVWIKGHNPEAKKSAVQKIFSHVDRAARRRLREGGF